MARFRSALMARKCREMVVEVEQSVSSNTGEQPTFLTNDEAKLFVNNNASRSYTCHMIAAVECNASVDLHRIGRKLFLN